MSTSRSSSASPNTKLTRSSTHLKTPVTFLPSSKVSLKDFPRLRNNSYESDPSGGVWRICCILFYDLLNLSSPVNERSLLSLFEVYTSSCSLNLRRNFTLKIRETSEVSKTESLTLSCGSFRIHSERFVVS